MENQTEAISNWAVLLVDIYFVMNTKSLRDRTAHTDFPELGKSVTPLSKWENTKQCCRRMMCVCIWCKRVDILLMWRYNLERVDGKNRIWNVHSDARRVSSTVTMPRMLHVLVFSFRVSSMCIQTWRGISRRVLGKGHETHALYATIQLYVDETYKDMYVHVFKDEFRCAGKLLNQCMHTRNQREGSQWSETCKPRPVGTLIAGEEVSNLSWFPTQTRGVRKLPVSSLHSETPLRTY